MQDRIAFIHLLRGIAPLFVVWAHLGGAWYAGTHNAVYPGFQWFRDVFSAPLHLYQDGAHLAVVTFFLISGFIISHVGQRETLTEFVSKRALRLLPAFFLAILTMFLLARLSTALGLPAPWGTRTDSILDYLGTALFFGYVFELLPGLTVAWTLYVEAIFYGIFALCISMVKTSPLKATLFLMLMAAVLIAPMHFSDYVLHQQHQYTVFLPMFIIGRVLFLHRNKMLRPLTVAVLCAVNFGALIYIYEYGRPGYLLTPPYEPIVTYAAAVLIFYAAMSVRIKKVPSAISYLADISYSLYLFHYPVGAFTMNALFAAGLPLDVLIAGGVVSSLVAASLVTWLVEKPIQRFGRRLLYGGAVASVAANLGSAKSTGLLRHDTIRS